MMGSNGEQPSGKGTLAIIPGEVLVRLEEGLLGRIFSGFHLTQHPVTKVVDRFLVSFDQVRKRVIVAVLGLDDPGHFVSH
jgi:hypothetical protein